MWQVKLERVEFVDPATSTLHRTFQRTASGDATPGFVPHFGYVSLFPLLLKLLPHVRVPTGLGLGVKGEGG